MADVIVPRRVRWREWVDGVYGVSCRGLDVDAVRPQKKRPTRLFLRCRREFSQEDVVRLRLSHPNIAVIYRVGDGEWHIVIDPKEAIRA